MAQYQDISEQIEKLVGGRDNISHVTHCATRLRLVLKDNKKADMEGLENIRLVKGVFVAGDQLQMIFGAGLVNNIYDEFSSYIGINSDSKIDDESSQGHQNPLQRFMKALSDVFIEIMPCILAAALLMGLSSLLTTKDLFGAKSLVEHVPGLAGFNRVVSIASSGIFALLPMIVAYSATKRFGGRASLGLAIGAVMIHPNLSDAYAVAGGTAKAEIANVFGLT